MRRSLLHDLAKDLATALEHAPVVRGPRARMSLLDFVPYLSPRFSRPNHLAPLAALHERALREPVRAVVHAPPRHGKTELELHGIAWTLCEDPSTEIVYATYGADLSYSKSRRARELTQAAGVSLRGDATAVKEWRTTAGGGLLATGVGGPLTGHGARLLLVDDPFKNRVEAESSAHRERVWDWWTSVAETRIEPGGSAIVYAARWHPDDLSGRLIKKGWEYVRLPAIGDEGTNYEGRSLWPERWSLAELEAKRIAVGPYDWASLYQGTPRVRGGKVFRDVHYYEQLPKKGFRVAIGADFAYSKHTSADHSVAVVFYEDAGTLYVVKVLRMQTDPPDFATRAGVLQKAHGDAPALAYVSTTEKGVASLASGFGFRCRAELASGIGDKFVRAQPYAATWNAGKVLVPRSCPDWLPRFLSEHLDFTGLDDAEDDQVDAGAAGHDLLIRRAGSMTASELEEANAGFEPHRDAL